MTRRPPGTTLFPYTTLFRSGRVALTVEVEAPEHGHAVVAQRGALRAARRDLDVGAPGWKCGNADLAAGVRAPARSEEHTSELSHSQISYAVFCLKKKNKS